MGRHEAVLAAALALPEKEREELMLCLIETIDEPADADVEEAWTAEIEARVAALREGRAEVISIDEAMASARERVRARRSPRRILP
ncbi:MAG: addiction module protein [Minicystis sp.]